jgi:hypothetical protein
MQRKWYSCALVLVATILGGVRFAIAQADWFVDVDATGNNTGTSWGNAFNDLQDALGNPLLQEDDEIWVAAGTYIPSVPTGRTATFDLDTLNLQIFGGFAGTENTLAERDIAANETILSGGTAPSYHVVTVNDISELNGFTVSDGRADALFHTYGGGIRAGPGALGDEHHIAVVNCIIENNSAGVYPNPEPTAARTSIPATSAPTSTRTAWAGSRICSSSCPSGARAGAARHRASGTSTGTARWASRISSSSCRSGACRRRSPKRSRRARASPSTTGMSSWRS